MGKNQQVIRKSIQAMGGTIKRIIPERSFYYVEINGEKIFINQKFVIGTSLFSRKQPTDFKDLTYILFKEAGIPTPDTVCFYRKNITKTDIDEKLKSLSYPIVIKDANGTLSRGVFANIKNFEEAKKILLEEITNFSCLIAQEMIFGKEYRVLILGDQAIGVLEMIPPKILGDGHNTTKELIAKKQETTEKKTPLDETLTAILKEQGESLDSIPAKNKEVFLRKISALSEGGETRDVTDLIHKDIVDLCAKTAYVVYKKLAGLDIICEDITKSPSDQKIYILEANQKPDLYIHYNPTYGQTRDVVKNIIEFILKIKKTNPK